MLTRLEQTIGQLDGVNIKLILLTGPSGSGKTRMLCQLGDKFGVSPLNLNLLLGRRLSAIPQATRTFLVGQLLQEIAEDANDGSNLLLLDNIEILFESSLQINPLELIKRIAHSKRVVAVWPGELRAKRLVYAEMTHQEYRDYDTHGVVIFEI